MTKQTSQEHLTEAKNVLQCMENVQRYAQTEGQQSNIPSNINQTITGLREYIQQAETRSQFISEALQKAPQQQKASGS